MPYPTMSFTKDWTNPEDFPTYEEDEQQVREDMQLLFDELKQYLNDTLAPFLSGSDGAGSIGFESLPGLYSTNVQAAIAELLELVNEISQGAVPDGSISTAKLAALAVTSAKLADAAVTVSKLADGAVTAAKLADGAVSAAKLGELVVTADKLANSAVTSAKLAGGAVTTDKFSLSAKAPYAGRADTAAALLSPKSFKVTDATGENEGEDVSFDGRSNAVLKLPETIAAEVDGNAATASKLSSTFSVTVADAAGHAGTAVPVDGSADVTLPMPTSIAANIELWTAVLSSASCGDALPAAGVPGRIFFLRVSG